MSHLGKNYLQGAEQVECKRQSRRAAQVADEVRHGDAFVMLGTSFDSHTNGAHSGFAGVF